jgi:hypothetical protein
MVIGWRFAGAGAVGDVSSYIAAIPPPSIILQTYRVNRATLTNCCQPLGWICAARRVIFRGLNAEENGD